jgi:hypothetical protein
MKKKYANFYAKIMNEHDGCIIDAGAHIRGGGGGGGGGGAPPPHVLWNISKKSVPKPEWDEKVGPAKIWKIKSFCVEKSNIGGHFENGSCINI